MLDLLKLRPSVLFSPNLTGFPASYSLSGDSEPSLQAALAERYQF